MTMPYGIHIVATGLHAFALFAVFYGLLNDVWVNNIFQGGQVTEGSSEGYQYRYKTTYTLWHTSATYTDKGEYTISETVNYETLLENSDAPYCSSQGPPFRNLTWAGGWIAPNGIRSSVTDSSTNGDALSLIHWIRVVLFFAFIGAAVDVIIGCCFMFGRLVTHRGITFFCAFVAGCLAAVSLGLFVYFNNLCGVLSCFLSRWNSCESDWKTPFGLIIGGCIAKGFAAFMMIVKRPRRIVEAERASNPVLIGTTTVTQVGVPVVVQPPPATAADPGFVYGKGAYTSMDQ